ncbi:MAG: hypothetical protein ACI88C_002268 [Acidimicrobiales bacterium]
MNSLVNKLGGFGGVFTPSLLAIPGLGPGFVASSVDLAKIGVNQHRHGNTNQC